MVDPRTNKTATRLRTVIITGEDPFYINRFFRELLQQVPNHPVELLGIVNLKPFNAPSKFALARRMLRFYGPVDFLRMTWRYLLSKIRGANLARLAARSGVPMLKTRNINSKSFLARLRGMNPDVVVSVSAPQIFRKRLLSTPRLGCWNLHGGKLPRYRGMMPSFWTLLSGEREGAITVHKMNPRLDDGDILHQYVYPIQPGESLDHLIVRTKVLGARVLLDALDKLASGDFRLQPNDAAQATYFSFPTPKEVRAFRKKGLKLL